MVRQQCGLGGSFARPWARPRAPGRRPGRFCSAVAKRLARKVNPTAPERCDNACQQASGDYSAPARKDALPRAALRRDGRVAEGARLESVYTGNRIVGSNPAPLARPFPERILQSRPTLVRGAHFGVLDAEPLDSAKPLESESVLSQAVFL